MRRASDSNDTVEDCGAESGAASLRRTGVPDPSCVRHPESSHMRRPTRALATVAAAALPALLLSTVALATEHEQPADPAFRAASWIASELAADDDGVLDGFSGGDVGITVDGVLALTITGVGGDVVARSTDAVVARLDGYVAPGGTVDGGAAAKAVLLANALGRDVNDVGGRDLEADLRAAVAGDGSIGASLFAHALGVMALSVVAGDAGDPDLTAASAYLDGSCEAVTGCGSGPDTDAVALVAFRDAGDASSATELADVLEATQAADGSFSSFGTPNTNSTGLAGWALGLAGRSAAADAAAAFVASLQLGDGVPPEDRGALAFAAEGFGSLQSAEDGGGIPDGERGSFQFATVQGVLGLSAGFAGTAWSGASTEGDAAGVPPLASPVGACSDDTGVTLVVDPASLAEGEPTVVCVTPFSGMDGLDLLLAGGFDVTTQDSSFGPGVCRLDGRPTDVLDTCFGSERDPDGYWASYVGTRDSVAWDAATTGVAGDSPVGGDVRGWVWEDDATDDTQVLPAVAPATSGISVDVAASDSDADTQEVALEERPRFTVTVASTGSATLTDVLVDVDGAEACDRQLDDLTEGGSVTYECDGDPASDDLTVTAAAAATPLGGSDPVTASDSTSVTVQLPATGAPAAALAALAALLGLGGTLLLRRTARP